jgi:hypothetical protein
MWLIPATSPTKKLTGYWSDVRTAAKAIERAYRPCQLNYGTFGNAVPHVHTHITPRYPDDPAPGRPLPDWVFANAPVLEPDQLADQLARLRRQLSRASDGEDLDGAPGTGVALAITNPGRKAGTARAAGAHRA